MTTTDAPRVRCATCAAGLRPGDRFCTTCGTPSPPPAPRPAPPRQAAVPTQRWTPPPASARPPVPPPMPPPMPPLMPPPAPPAVAQRSGGRRLVIAAVAVLALLAVGTTVFVVVRGGSIGEPGPGTTAPVAAPAPAAPTPALPSDPGTALQTLRATDAGRAEALVGAWIPQLSAKKDGMVVDGTTYDAAAILADHLRLRAAHPDALLVWSGAFTSFRGGDFWVTVVGRSFPSAAAANAWCDSAGLGADDCYAKRLSHTEGVAGNTVQRSGVAPAAVTPASGDPVLGDPGWGPGVIGFGVARPSEVNANGDGTSHADGVTWSSWGGPRAQGRATAYWVPPGGFQYQAVARPAVVVAWDLGDCHGRLAYRQVSWYFPSEGESPPSDGYHICDGG